MWWRRSVATTPPSRATGLHKRGLALVDMAHRSDMAAAMGGLALSGTVTKQHGSGMAVTWKRHGSDMEAAMVGRV